MSLTHQELIHQWLVKLTQRSLQYRNGNRVGTDCSQTNSSAQQNKVEPYS